jgi:hypothetical protein
MRKRTAEKHSAPWWVTWEGDMRGRTAEKPSTPWWVKAFFSKDEAYEKESFAWLVIVCGLGAGVIAFLVAWPNILVAAAMVTGLCLAHAANYVFSGRGLSREVLLIHGLFTVMGLSGVTSSMDAMAAATRAGEGVFHWDGDKLGVVANWPGDRAGGGAGK